MNASQDLLNYEKFFNIEEASDEEAIGTVIVDDNESIATTLTGNKEKEKEENKNKNKKEQNKKIKTKKQKQNKQNKK